MEILQSEVVDKMVKEIRDFRSDAFKRQNEKLYVQLGRAMGNLIDARQELIVEGK